MNNYNINLLTDRRHKKALAPILKKLRLLRLSSVLILFIVGLGSIILSIFIVISPLPKLREEEQRARKSLSIFKTDIAKLQLINDRGKDIGKIIQTRPRYDRKIELIQSKTPPQVTLDEISITEKNYKLKFSSTDLHSLEEVLSHITEITGPKKEFSKTFLTNLSKDTNIKKFILTIDLLSV